MHARSTAQMKVYRMSVGQKDRVSNQMLSHGQHSRSQKALEHTDPNDLYGQRAAGCLATQCHSCDTNSPAAYDCSVFVCVCWACNCLLATVLANECINSLLASCTTTTPSPSPPPCSSVRPPLWDTVKAIAIANVSLTMIRQLHLLPLSHRHTLEWYTAAKAARAASKGPTLGGALPVGGAFSKRGVVDHPGAPVGLCQACSAPFKEVLSQT